MANPTSTRSPLTPKQAAFVREYQVDLNATQAAIRAGYAESSAHVTGSTLLRHPKVSAALAKVTETAIIAVQQNLGGAVITAERVLQEYARIAFADMRRFATVTKGGISLTDSEAWSDDDAAAVAELGETVSKEGGSVRFKLHSKTAALDSLAKYLRLLGNDDEPSGAQHLHLHGLSESDLRAIASGHRT